MVIYVNNLDQNPRRITKPDKKFAKKLDFENKKFIVEIRDIPKIEKNNSIGISVFRYENKGKHSICASKKIVEKNVFTYY